MERILIRSTNWLGDSVMSVPAVRAIRAARPSSHIAVLTPEKLADIWQLVPEVDEVIPFPSPKGRGLLRAIRGVGDVFRVAKKIRGMGFTAGAIFPNSIRTALEMWLARIPTRIGFAGHGRRSFFLTTVVAKEEALPATAPGRHQVHLYLHLADALVGGAIDSGTDLECAADNRANPAVGGRYQIAVCPGAEYGPAKRWIPARFAEVIQTISASNDVRWIVVGTAKDGVVADDILAECGTKPQIENLCGKTSLQELIAALRECDALVTNDTGTMHLAALLGVPTVSIFGSTEPALTGPLGRNHIVVRRHVECSPCFLRECPIDFRCMNDVDSDSVVSALSRVLHLSLPAAGPPSTL